MVVYLQEKYSYFLDRERLHTTVVKYMDLLETPIYIEEEGPVNQMSAPWLRVHWSTEKEKERVYREFLNRRYPDDLPVDVIPIEIDEEFSARGALLISARNMPDIATGGVMDVFVRRAFVRGEDREFLPPWAKFVRGVIDSPDLQPNAARDNIQRKEPAFGFLQKRLGQIIVDRLKYLARHEPRKFEGINRYHHYHLKGMAARHEDFFAEVADLLLFETNKGLMALRDYLTKNSPVQATGKLPIYYFSFGGADTQFFLLANARGWAVIDAGRVFDEELLKKYAQSRPQVQLIRLDEADHPELFQPIDGDPEKDKYARLELDIERLLRGQPESRVSVQTRRFDPETMPSALITSPLTQAEQVFRDFENFTALASGFDNVTQRAVEEGQLQPMRLFLNAKDPLIRALADIADRSKPPFPEVLLAVYNSAYLLSRNLLTRSNAQTIHLQIQRLLKGALEQASQLASLAAELEGLRKRYAEAVPADGAPKPEHLMLFLMIPFKDRFQNVERAVRRVFERAPYFFEVRLDRDFTLNQTILDNVRSHIQQANGFIADITGPINANVMLELGAVMIPNDGRPIFTLRSRESQDDVPKDINNTIQIEYGRPEQSPEEIEAAIRSKLEADGRVKNQGLLDLLNQRKKRHLSPRLLEALKFTKLGESQIRSLCGKYRTVEDIVDPKADVARISAETGLQKYIIEAIRGELQEGLL